jgi:hypothetical protein
MGDISRLMFQLESEALAECGFVFGLEIKADRAAKVTYDQASVPLFLSAAVFFPSGATYG